MNTLTRHLTHALLLALLGDAASAEVACCAVEPFAPKNVAAPPDAARGVQIPKDKGYYVGDLGDGLYWVTDGFYTTMFLTSGRGVIVLDAPPSLGQNLLNAIGEVTREPVRIVIYSHAHADHIGAAALYPKDATYVAHAATLARLKHQDESKRATPYGVFVGGGKVPLPTKSFDKQYTVKLGSQTLQLTYDGDDHEPGNLYVWVPKQKVLAKIDIVFPGWSPFADLAVAEDVPGYLRAVDRILGYDFKHLVSGHWNRLATRADVEVQRAYLNDISANATQALQTTHMGPLFQQTGFAETGNLALLFDTYLKTVAQKCAAATIPKWQSRLGGVDVFTYSHCYAVVMSQRLD